MAKTANNMNKNSEPPQIRRDVASELLTPPPTAPRRWRSVADVRRAFSLPASLGCSEDIRMAQDEAFSAGYGAYFSSLTQHALDLGQYPPGGFVGYGVLQQIAQNGLIRACIQTVADEMTREWIEIKGGSDSDPERIEKLADLAENKYKLRKLFNKAFSTVGYMGGALIYVDTMRREDKAIQLPLRIKNDSQELAGEGRGVRFVLVDPINISPGSYNSTDPLRPDYMNPRWWWVLGKRVDASRMLKLVDNEPPMLLKPSYNFLGIPQAQILWDYVLHWNKARESTVSLLEKLNFLTFKTNMEDVINAGGIANLDAKVQAMNRYRSNNSLFVCDQTEDIQNVTLSISGATDITKQALEFVASINRTPAVKLLGISPSGFNATGESDIRNYYDHVASKQEKARDAIQSCLNCIQLVEFGEIDPSITFDFKELGAEDENSKLTTAKTKVDTLTALQDRNVISADETRAVVRQDPALGLDFIGEEAPEDPEAPSAFGDPNADPNEGAFPAFEQLQAQMGGNAPAGNAPAEAQESPDSLLSEVTGGQGGSLLEQIKKGG